jgi:nitroimidazol reductase NimA-like FMN-containing flavoprotein (pyridoxamine 5'-phosphate oxidase superfamily)
MTIVSPVLNYAPPAKTGKLNQTEMEAFLALPWNARLATVTPRLTPYVAPVWYQFDPATHLFYVVARERSQYVAHIQQNPAVALHIADDVHREHTRVLVEGLAQILEGPAPPEQSPQLRELVLALSRRYLGEQGPTYAQRTMDRPRYLIQITPQRWQSWSGGEWAPRYR